MLAYSAGLAILGIAACTLDNATSDMESLIMSVKPRKSVILPGEPLAVDVRIENRAYHPISIDLGYNGIGAFWFEIASTVGQTISTSERISKSGFALSGRRTLRPGEATEAALVMNMWCSTLLPAGEYTVFLNWETRVGAEHELKGRETFALRVMPADDEKLATLLEKLKDHALVSNREFDVQMLLASDAPVAVNPIRKFMAEIREWRKFQAVESLGRIVTVESVQTLTEVALERHDVQRSLAVQAAAMVYQIYDNAADKPEVREACQRVMDHHPRRPAPVRVID